MTFNRKRFGLLAAGWLAASLLPGQTAEESAKEVAALDARYQAAVKANDVSTMGLILSDDFVLVNGRGKTFSKNELLEEARNKTTIYEKQDELEQHVRV